MKIESDWYLKVILAAIASNMNQLKYMNDYTDKQIVSDLIEESESHLKEVKRYLVNRYLVD